MASFTPTNKVHGHASSSPGPSNKGKGKGKAASTQLLERSLLMEPYQMTQDGYRTLFLKIMDQGYNKESCGSGWALADEPSANSPFLLISESILEAVRLVYKVVPIGVLDSESWESLMDAAAKVDQDWMPDRYGTKKVPETATLSSETPEDQLLRESAVEEIELEDLEKSTESLESSSDSSASSPVLSTQPSNSVQKRTARPEPFVTVVRTRRAKPVPFISNKKPRLTTKTPKGEQPILTASQTQRPTLLPPIPAEAPFTEQQAYSAAVERREIGDYMWLFGQTYPENGKSFLQGSGTPYTLANQWLGYVSRFGNNADLQIAMTFLQSWRESGHPLQTSSSPSIAVVNSNASTREILRNAVNWATVMDKRVAVMNIQYSWAMADLFLAYQAREAEIKLETRTRMQQSGSRIKTMVIDEMLHDSGVGQHDRDFKVKREQFKVYLANGKRWYTAVEVFGWGILLLLPYQDLPRTMVEKRLNVNDWKMFLNFLHHTRPDIVAACQDFSGWLGKYDGANKTSIRDRPSLRLESGVVNEVEEEVSEDDPSRGIGGIEKVWAQLTEDVFKLA